MHTDSQICWWNLVSEWELVLGKAAVVVIPLWFLGLGICVLISCPGNALNVRVKLFELGVTVLLDLKISDKCWRNARWHLLSILQEKPNIFTGKNSLFIFTGWTYCLVTMEYHVYNRRKIVVCCRYWSKTLYNSFSLVWTAFVVGVLMLYML